MTDDKVAILIKKTALVIEKLSNHALAPYELTHTQYKILMLLYRKQDQPLRQIDVENHFAMTNPSVTGIIQNLEKKRLVQRVPNPEDRRSKLLVLTERALSMRQELHALGESLEKQVTANLSGNESRQLIELLNKILQMRIEGEEIMIELNRFGLGTMGMNRSKRETSIKTIHAALDAGITLFNTGEFYQGSESEMVFGEAVKGVDWDSYFLSVKFGVLPSPEGGIYGLDVKPHNVKGHLTYSLRRLGLDYVDLYQPARMDTTMPVEELVGAIADQVQAGFVKHIGLTMVDAEALRRACKVHPIHTVEMSYSLIDRSIEAELIAAAKELNVKVLAFGTIGHGLLTDRALDMPTNSYARDLLSPENRDSNLALLREVKKIADEKGVNLSQRALAWSLAKHEHVQGLVGTTSTAHLQESINALKITLTEEDIRAIETAIPEEKVKGRGMRNYVFTDGKMSLAQ